MMKRIALQVLLALLFGTAAFSQKANITASFNNQDIKSVLAEIEEASEYSFFYKDEDLNLSRRYTKTFTDASLSGVLDEVLGDQELTYRINNRTIVVLPIDKVNEQEPQKITISGTVTDKETGETIPGVNIQVEGRNIGTITDVSGRYELEVESLDRLALIFSFIGYYTVKVEPAGRSEINVALESDIQNLEEVIVIGYGVQKKKDLTGAVGVVDIEEMQKVQNTGIGEALQGQLAGVSVRSGGAPGSWANVRIRGVGSFSDVGPLYVIDGLILNDADHLNVADIESMQILKDASAAAIYGARGANGVIIITTKKGKEGPAEINFSARYGVEELSKKIDMMETTDYLYYNQLGYINGGEEWLGRPGLGDTIPNTDWQDAIFSLGEVQDYNLSVAGGTHNSRYMIGAGYFSQDGVLEGPWYNRLTFRVNSQTTKGRITVGENFSYIRSNQKYTNGGSFSNALSMPPVIPVYDPDEVSGRGGYGYGNVMYPTYASNPVALQQREDNTEMHNRLIGNVFAELEILPGLKFKSNLGIDHWTGRHKITNEGHTVRYLSVETRWEDRLWEERVHRTNMSIDNTLTYNLNFGKHQFEALLGNTVENSKWYFLGNEGYNQSVEGKWQINLAEVQNNMWGWEGEYHMISYLGRINYNYDNKYLFQSNMRRDGSSKFGPNRKWGFFPSASFGWRVSNEAFFEPVKNTISDLKFRVSYGSNGDQQALGAYDVTPVINHSGPYEGLYYVIGGQILQGAIQTSRANPDLHWESKKTLNVGLDFGLWRNKLYGSVEWYHSNSTGLLVQLPLALATGVGISFAGNDAIEWTNYGEMVNTGFEATTGWKEVRGDFSYNVNLNFSTIKNTVVELGESFREGGSSNVNRTEEGRSVSEFYLIKTDGIFQSMDEVFDHTTTLEDGTIQLIQPGAKPGDIRYEDFNGDGQIDLNDRQWCGSPLPDLELGLNASMMYKGFDFNMFITSIYGNKIYNVMRTSIEGMGGPDNLPGYFSPWTWDNPSLTDPRPVKGTSDNAKAQTDRWLEDGSFIRLKNMQLGYTVPESIVSKTGIVQEFRIYISGQNLITLSKYKGYDPELTGGGVFGQGNDWGGYPPVRSYMAGLQISF
jgi:TonB-dependent starch-binding outer membrane protein SusC